MATANNEFFEALSALEKERGLPEDYLIDKIKAAIVIAVKKDYEVEDDNVVVDIDPELGAFRASLLRDIVEEVENPHTQVSLEDAQKVRKSYKVGQRMVTPLKTKEFGRIAAQTAKHVIDIDNVLDQVRVLVDDDNVVIFRRKLGGQGTANLAEADDHDSHTNAPFLFFKAGTHVGATIGRPRSLIAALRSPIVSCMASGQRASNARPY